MGYFGDWEMNCAEKTGPFGWDNGRKRNSNSVGVSNCIYEIGLG